MSHWCTKALLHRLCTDFPRTCAHTHTHKHTGSVLLVLCLLLVFEVTCQSQHFYHVHLSAVPWCTARPLLYMLDWRLSHIAEMVHHSTYKHKDPHIYTSHRLALSLSQEHTHWDKHTLTVCWLHFLNRSLISCQILTSIRLNILFILWVWLWRH